MALMAAGPSKSPSGLFNRPKARVKCRISTQVMATPRKKSMRALRSVVMVIGISAVAIPHVTESISMRHSSHIVNQSTLSHRFALGLQQTTGRIFVKAARFLDIAMHRAVVPPAALAFDGLEVGAGAVGAGGHAAAQTVARQFRYVLEPRQPGAAFQYGIDAARMQPFCTDLPPLVHRAQQRPGRNIGCGQPAAQRGGRAAHALTIRYRLDDALPQLIGL